MNRREMIRTSALGAAWLASLGIPEQVWALQDGEELVTFTDYTEAFQIEASPANTRVRCFDLRRLTTWTTPNDEFYAFAQTTTQKVDAASYRLHISGFVDKPRELTLDRGDGAPRSPRDSRHAGVFRELDTPQPHERAIE